MNIVCSFSTTVKARCSAHKNSNNNTIKLNTNRQKVDKVRPIEIIKIRSKSLLALLCDICLSMSNVDDFIQI